MSYNCHFIKIIGSKQMRFDPVGEDGITARTWLVDRNGDLVDHLKLPIGTVFEVPQNADYNLWPWYEAKPEMLSDYYHQRNAHRRPLFVILPGRHLFLVDGKEWNGGRSYGGWTVSGPPECLTITPSINIAGFYHGFLANGIIGDDVEGRQFDENGYKCRPSNYEILRESQFGKL